MCFIYISLQCPQPHSNDLSGDCRDEDDNLQADIFADLDGGGLAAPSAGSANGCRAPTVSPALSSVLLPYMMASAGGALLDQSALLQSMSFLKRRAWAALSVLVERLEKFRLGVREERMQMAANEVRQAVRQYDVRSRTRHVRH